MEHKTNPDSNKAHPSDQKGKTNPKSTTSKDIAHPKAKGGTHRSNADSDLNEWPDDKPGITVNQTPQTNNNISRTQTHNSKQLVRKNANGQVISVTASNNKVHPAPSSQRGPIISQLGKTNETLGPNHKLSAEHLKDLPSEGEFLLGEDGIPALGLHKLLSRLPQNDEQTLTFIMRIFEDERVSLKLENRELQEVLVMKGLSEERLKINHKESLKGAKSSDISIHKDFPESARSEVSKKLSGMPKDSLQFKFNKSIAPKSEEVINSIISSYLPLAVFYVLHLKIDAELETAAKLSEVWRDVINFETFEPFFDDSFSIVLLNLLLDKKEYETFKLYLSSFEDLNLLVCEQFFSKFFLHNRYDYLVEFYNCYKTFAKQHPLKKDQVTLFTRSEDSLVTKPNNSDGKVAILDYNHIQKLSSAQKMNIFIKNYFKATDEDQLLMDIFQNLKMSKEAIVSRLLHCQEEERFIRICHENESLIEYLVPERVLTEKQYKLLILFDGMELINIFNMKVDLVRKKGKNIYEELCSRIQQGVDVEDLCNVIVHVNETFWDMDKMLKFYEALKQLLYNPKINWLVYIQNPLLFYMTLIKFFKDIKKQLDYRNPEINELTDDMMNFCKHYINNASEESLKINLFDRDSNDKTFLHYAFLVADMGILETEQIEDLIHQMWDLDRHTLQTVEQFMRLDFMRSEIKRFDFGVYTRKYEIPIEEGDSFQMEYKYASNSISSKSLSDVFWIIPVIIIEFIFSMDIISRHLNDPTNKKWFTSYMNEYPTLFIIHGLLRINMNINVFIKTLVMKTDHSVINNIVLLHKIFLSLNFVQFIVYPFILPQFWVINNSQMLLVLALVSYVLYICLSMNDYGVILRIFGSMSKVVIIFGTVSVLLITIVAYPIHTIFINFSQQIEGQIYKDLNLFSDLYQGILTCFEFVFGAVVLVRPYQEENLYTYATSFIMMMFSFFGNIMLANMLIAFLTSQFDEISRNAKYLTMNMQFGLIAVFSAKDLDTIYSLPPVLTIVALPFYAFMISRKKRRRINLFLRKVIHVVNIFIPTFILMNFKLFLLLLWRYVGIFIELILGVTSNPMNIVYALSWIFAAPILLFKLWFLDIKTMCKILLNFSEDGEELTNYELDDRSRSNILHIFKKMNRVVQHEYGTKGTTFISKREFMETIGVVDVQDWIFQGVQGLGGESAENLETRRKLAENDFSQLKLNVKYQLSQEKLAPLLLSKFSIRDDKGEEKVDLKLMYGKLKNTVNMAGVDKLIAFENEALEKAKKFFKEFGVTDAGDEVKIVQEKVNTLGDKIKNVMRGMHELKSLINK